LPRPYLSARWLSRASPNEKGERIIYLDDRMADRLGAMRS
jgi:hypothetical protein